MRPNTILLRKCDLLCDTVKSKQFPNSVLKHINTLASNYTVHDRYDSQCRASDRRFSTSPFLSDRNRVQPSIRRPADFLTLLNSSATTNTLLLALFRTSSCRSCEKITPLIESIVQSRPVPSPGDNYGSIAFTELELDSPERDEGGGRGWSAMYDIGVEYGVHSVPTLIGFGGRRAERVTERLADEHKLSNKQFMQDWIDEAMKTGDPHPMEGGKGLFARIFGGGS